MSRNSKFAILVILFNFLNSACNEVRFTPTNKNRRVVTEPEVNVQGLNPTCSVASIEKGQNVAIEVSKFDASKSSFFQKVTFKGVNGQEATTVYEGVLNQGDKNFNQGALVSLPYAPDADGEYEIAIFEEQTSPVALTSCDFALNIPVNVDCPEGNCKDTVEPGCTEGVDCPPVEGQPVLVTCQVLTPQVQINDQITVLVNSTKEVRGNLVQTISTASGFTTQSTLTMANGQYVDAVKGNNTFSFSEQGDYTVSYNVIGGDPSQPVQTGTCSFSVKPPLCEDVTKKIGANVAFIIDNSSSHEVTDCPGATLTGEKDSSTGHSFWRCSAPTEREKAVLKGVDLLSDMTDRFPEAVNHVSLTIFPTRQNHQSGYSILGEGWLEASATNRDAVERLLDITRTPYGQTPYGAGVEASSRLFQEGSLPGKTPVVIFLTDGEPTDRNPGSTANEAASLIASGVEVISIKIDSGMSDDERWNSHSDILEKFNIDNLNSSGNTWFDPSYETFDNYLASLRGVPGLKPSLLQSMTSKVDPTCEDVQGFVCPRRIVNVKDASGLQSVVESIIKDRVIQCQ